jgi:hypothetical protein
MALTKAEAKLRHEAEALAELAKLDFWNIESQPKEFRKVGLQIAINKIAISVVVGQYTLLDEILADCICSYYFKKKGKRRFLLWKDSKFRVFVNYLLDETYLIKKLDTVNALKPVPRSVKSIIHRVNSLRNAMTHSFFPENRKEHRVAGRILYEGKDIRTREGITAFLSDSHDAWSYLARRTYGVWDGIKEGDGKWDEKTVK